MLILACTLFPGTFPSRNQQILLQTMPAPIEDPWICWLEKMDCCDPANPFALWNFEPFLFFWSYLSHGCVRIRPCMSLIWKTKLVMKGSIALFHSQYRRLFGFFLDLHGHNLLKKSKEKDNAKMRLLKMSLNLKDLFYFSIPLSHLSFNLPV